MITRKILEGFEKYLMQEEKSEASREKYLHIAEGLAEYAQGRELSKELLVAYKQQLSKRYAERTVNVNLAGINSLLGYLKLDEYRLKYLKIQRQTYLEAEKEMTKQEYLRLLKAAEGDKRLHVILETICGTGIRVSELKYFTVEAVQAGEIHIRLKGKCRVILIPRKLRRKLLDYGKRNGIRTGILFRNRHGRALDRSSVWWMMKKLCRTAGVSASKVFPHNLRKLFAKCFYQVEKDIAKLADILGHSSIDTTRIYIMTSGQEHRRIIERMGLVM